VTTNHTLRKTGNFRHLPLLRVRKSRIPCNYNDAWVQQKTVFLPRLFQAFRLLRCVAASPAAANFLPFVFRKSPVLLPVASPAPMLDTEAWFPIGGYAISIFDVAVQS